MEENPQSTSTLVASENEVSQTTVIHILRKENHHPYKFQLVQELNEDDPDRRLQFCEIIMNLCHTNPKYSFRSSHVLSKQHSEPSKLQELAAKNRAAPFFNA
ncbi:hypothetical protein NQ318_007012 [Aromia moschata]|uniref:Uncharacterized protein n=1 Tax=Aromia moschata TaxID=1265417 RepID=A0AAV8XH55_9CUCU|nr:hypothetical protein NQ318_007012 [Aromia moschata]